MSQKQITSFFTRKAAPSTPEAAAVAAAPPRMEVDEDVENKTKPKEAISEKIVAKKDKTPLKAANPVEDDSPVKASRRSNGSRKRILSSSSEDEPEPSSEEKQDSPVKAKKQKTEPEKKKSESKTPESKVSKTPESKSASKEEDENLSSEEKAVEAKDKTPKGAKSKKEPKPKVEKAKKEPKPKKEAKPKVEKAKKEPKPKVEKTPKAAKGKKAESKTPKSAKKMDSDAFDSSSSEGKDVSFKKESPDEEDSPQEDSAEAKTPKSKSPKAKSSTSKSPKDESPEKKSPDAKTPKTPALLASAPADANDYSEVVKRSRYDPIDNATWKRSDKTPYLAFAKTLQAIEATSGRLKTIEILANYFRSVLVLTPDDLLPSVYMCLNRIAPAYEGKELGIGDQVLMKAIAQTTGRSLQHIKADVGKKGDLGIVAETSRGTQRIMFQPAPLTVAGVFSKLKEIGEMTGHSSMNKKTEKIQSMLVACRQSEARFLIRSLAGKLRIGLAEQSVLQALAHACVQTPPCQDYPPEIRTAFKDASSDKFKEALEPQALKLKTAYCECPSYDKMIPILLKDGITGVVKGCKLTPGIPLKPMLAHPTKGVQEVLTRFENIKFTCEWKYDGERAQIHLLEDGSIQVYSRNQENNTSKYPDIIQRFKNCITGEMKSCILDSEAVAWDREKKQIQPFQVLSTRKRKDANESDIKVQVAVFAFDLLYLNGEPLVRRPLIERRELLHKNFKEIEGEFLFAKSDDPATLEEIQVLLEDSIKENCEGLMVKALEVDATYEIAKRSRNWLKLKKDYLDGVGDTIDVVVMGGYLGKGKRTGSYGGFLLGVYDPENEEYQTVCKIGTGFSDEDLQKHYTFFQDHIIDKPKSYYSFDPNLAPDHWFDLVQVWEIKAADLSLSPVHRAGMGIVDPKRGISLRFPRFIRVRDDKQAEDATNAQQIADMYNNQEQVKNQKDGGKPSSADDDFDF